MVWFVWILIIYFRNDALIPVLGLCCTLYTGLNDLQTYGLEKFYSWLKENFVENKKKKSSKAFLQCKQSKELQDVIRLTEKV